MLFAIDSWLLTVVCLSVSGVNCVLNEVNGKIPARLRTCDNEFRASNLHCSTRKYSSPTQPAPSLFTSNPLPPPSTYCSPPPIKDNLPFHQPTPFIMNYDDLALYIQLPNLLGR